MNLNIVKIKGNLVRDPELKHTITGKDVCMISIATNSFYTKNGKKITDVSYFDVEAWDVIAENCVKNFKKGNSIIVEGRLKQDRWEKDGKTQSRVKITASNVEFLINKKADISKAIAMVDNDISEDVVCGE